MHINHNIFRKIINITALNKWKNITKIINKQYFDTYKLVYTFSSNFIVSRYLYICHQCHICDIRYFFHRHYSIKYAYTIANKKLCHRCSIINLPKNY